MFICWGTNAGTHLAARENETVLKKGTERFPITREREYIYYMSVFHDEHTILFIDLSVFTADNMA